MTSRSGLRQRSAASAALLLVCALSLPWGAWASSGMETPLIVLLCTMALRSGGLAWASRGLAAALRPELIPWALVSAVLRPEPSRRATALALLWAGLPPLLVAVARQWMFGHPAPLAVFAKPSDLQSGLGYVVNGTWLLGLPLLWCSVRSWLRIDADTRAIAVAVAVHWGAVAVAGGDWMALFRLLIPMLPSIVLVSNRLLAQDDARWRWGKLILAGAATLLLLTDKGGDARSVFAAREQLVQEGRLALLAAERIATLDAGWVGAASGATVIDLAGVTDREVAYLPGGHTSKRLARDWLRRRQVDTLVLLLREPPRSEDTISWRAQPFARQVEARTALLDTAEDFVPTATLRLGKGPQHYLVLRRLRERMANTHAGAPGGH